MLRPHLISGDINKDLQAAKTQSAKAFTSLISMANVHRTLFTNLLSCLLISDIEVWNLLYDHIFINQETNRESNNSDPAGIESIKDIGVNLFQGISYLEIMEQLRNIYEGLQDEEIDEIIKDIIQIDIQSLVDKFNSKPTSNSIDKITEEIISFWINKLIENSLENDFIGKLSELQKEIFRGIINEIIKSRDRLELSNYISKTIIDIRQGALSSEDIDLVSSCVTTILNKFTFTSGWFLAEENKKPLMSETLPVFSENSHASINLGDLNYRKGNIPKTFFKEWNRGIKSIYEENIRYDYNFTGAFNSARNTSLEQIISTLAN